MPISELTGNRPEISLADVEELETTLGVVLPEGYRDFILRTNGGRPSPEAAFNWDEDGDGSVMALFYSVKHEEVTSTLAQRHFAFSNRIPAELLPIGYDLGGNMLCIGIGPKRYGKIFFAAFDLDFASPHGDRPSYRHIWQIADSFDEFIAGFYDDDSEPAQ